MLGLATRGWVIVTDVALAALGFVVFIWGDLTTHRGVRAGGIALVTLAFVVAAILSAFRESER